MKPGKIVGAVIAAGALSLAAGTAHAAPVTGSSDQTVHYVTASTGAHTVIKTDAGSLVVEDGKFKVESADGKTLGGTELSFRVDDFVFPVDAQIDGRTATLTPEFDLVHAHYEPVALPYEDQAPWKSDYDREQAAWSRLSSTISMGATFGTTAGVVGGAAAGCTLGAITGATLTGALATMFASAPAAAQGCIAGVGAGGFLGTLAGQIFVTAPVAIAAAAQYFTTINEPSPNEKQSTQQSQNGQADQSKASGK